MDAVRLPLLERQALYFLRMFTNWHLYRFILVFTFSDWKKLDPWIVQPSKASNMIPHRH